jgi:hypothetical protein
VTWDSAMLKELDKKKIIYTEKQFRKFMRHSEISMVRIIIFLPVLLIPMENQNWAILNIF